MQERCIICEKDYEKAFILRHQVDHFIPELIEYIKLQGWVKKSDCNEQICQYCSDKTPFKSVTGIVNFCLSIIECRITWKNYPKSNPLSFIELQIVGFARHHGLVHGVLRYFLELPEFVQRKRTEILNGNFKISQGHQQVSFDNVSCQLCNEMFEIGAHGRAIDHFSLHIWCDYTETIHNNRSHKEKPILENDDLKKFEEKYGLSKWLHDNKLFMGSSFAGRSDQIKHQFLKRVKNILSGSWCCLCQTVYEKSKFLSHYIDHFNPLIMKEISNWKLVCRLCNSIETEFLSHQNLKSHYIECHFKHKVASILADIRGVDFVLSLRKEMNIAVIVELDNETDIPVKTNISNPDQHKCSTDKYRSYTAANSTPEEPKPFLQMLTSVYDSDLSKQNSTASDFTSFMEKQQDAKTNNITSETHIQNRNCSEDLLGSKDTVLVRSSISSSSEENQYNSISVHMISDIKHKDGALAPHIWLCEGRLLLLLDPLHPNNMELFKKQWGLGQPILIANSSRYLNKKLWHPDAFLKDFGHLRHDLINCLTGQIVPKAYLHKFWKGFSWIKHRLRDVTGTPMLMKLKDWPPTEDLKDYMPKRFKDLFQAFPMQDYTMRTGNLNLAGYLPGHCLKPELGPKMYIAYGSALYSGKASTNLHIDMSDAVNCLVYVGFPKDGNMEENVKQVWREIDKAGCDIVMKRRVRSKNALPGALWHIFHPKHTIIIRSFLNQVAIEKGKRLDPHDDPIHDQSTYLDKDLRIRLYKEYGIQGKLKSKTIFC